MVDASYLFPPLPFTHLDALLQDLFGLGDIKGHQLVHGGYMGINFRLDTEHGVYFLKQYRNNMNTVVHEIKRAEAFFAQAGLPVIEPMKDRYGREAFWLEGNWYSLFPFVQGKKIRYGEMTASRATVLAQLLARFHHAGMQFTHRPFQMLRIGNARKFHLEVTELTRVLERTAHHTAIHTTIADLIELKTDLQKRLTLSTEDTSLPFDCLLHGDFQYLNVFIDEQDQITHIYDLERSSLGPPAYEVVRSLMLNCFDDGWEDRNFHLAQTFLSVYRERFPLSKADFLHALNIYTFNIIHMTWIESRYLIFGVESQLVFLERHKKRIEMLTSQDHLDFCARVWVDDTSLSPTTL